MHHIGEGGHKAWRRFRKCSHSGPFSQHQVVPDDLITLRNVVAPARTRKTAVFLIGLAYHLHHLRKVLKPLWYGIAQIHEQVARIA